MSRSPAARRYLRRLAVAIVAYMISVFVTLHVLYHGRLPLPAALGLATIPSIPLIAIIIVIALYLKEEKDDFQRELFIQSLLWGAGGTLALTSFWSFAHLFAHRGPNFDRVPPVDGFHVFILFWLLVGLAALPLGRYYGGSGE